jgi:lipoic acid synthetase
MTKSSIMVGLGETDDEVMETMRDLRAAGVDVVTLGQYLRPTPKHHEVVRFVAPATFDAWQRAAMEMGFLYAASGPLVRSSYRAAEVFVRTLVGTGRPERDADAATSAALAARLDEARRAASRLAGEGGASHGGSGLVPTASLVRRA